jgi:hypothetical protein
MVVHNFCIEHEHLATAFELDTFFQEGIRIMSEDRCENEAAGEDNADMDSIMRADTRDIELLEAQIRREKLKKALFDFYEQREEDENSKSGMEY